MQFSRMSKYCELFGDVKQREQGTSILNVMRFRKELIDYFAWKNVRFRSQNTFEFRSKEFLYLDEIDKV